MPIFIMLTEEDDKSICIDFSSVQAFAQRVNKMDTTIGRTVIFQRNSSNFWFVKETVEEIFDMLKSVDKSASS